MNRILLGTIFAAGLICAAGAEAAAYKCTDDGGHVVYSDIPCVKKAPPPPKAEPAAVVSKAADSAVLTKISEADVLRLLDLNEEYAHTNNAAEACNLLAAELKFRVDYQLPKMVKVISGGRDEACQLARASAEQAKKTGLIGLTERGPTKVSIEGGELRATATYNASCSRPPVTTASSKAFIAARRTSSCWLAASSCWLPPTTSASLSELLFIESRLRGIGQPRRAHDDRIAAINSAQGRRESLALAAAMAIIVVWGINFSVQKFVFDAVTPGGFLFVRYLIMPACALALLAYRHGWPFPRVARADFWALARMGLIGHFVHVGMVTYGIYWSTAFSSSLILACGPIFTLLILRFKGIERLHGAQVTGVAVAFAGVLVFLSDTFTGGHWQATGGDLFLLVAASFFSYYTVAAKPLIERLGGVTTMAYGTLLGSVPMVLCALPAGLSVDWRALSAGVWVGLLWSITISAFLGWLVWGWVNAVRGVARSAPLMYLMPPVAGLVAWLFTGEHFTAVKLAGAGVTLGGVAIAQFSTRGMLPRRPAP